ncbi:MAG TPA: hypothetical protein VHS09_13470 [Polyangiaceae bacterium]|jgi:hypothetical protein|nr:hypothetical protein [Polyangiaceae bacterium]
MKRETAKTPAATRATATAPALEVRALYTVSELARVAGVPTYRLLRLLRRANVVFLRSGRAFYVPLPEIREKVPALWRGLCAAEEVRRAAERG